MPFIGPFGAPGVVPGVVPGFPGIVPDVPGMVLGIVDVAPGALDVEAGSVVEGLDPVMPPPGVTDGVELINELGDEPVEGLELEAGAPVDPAWATIWARCLGEAFM